MEYILAFLFTFNYILKSVNGINLYHMVAFAALIWYVIKRRPQLKAIVWGSVFFLVYAVVVLFVSGNEKFINILWFSVIMLLNVTLAIYVIYNCKKWNLLKWSYIVVVIHAVETLIAIIFKNSNLWVWLTLTDGKQVHRLKLFYSEPAFFSFACGLILIFMVYQLLNEKVSWKTFAGIVVCVIDLYLSYGLGGIFATIFAVGLMLFALVVKNRHELTIYSGRKIRAALICAVMMGIVATFVVFSVPRYRVRLESIAKGQDVGFNINITNPYKETSAILNQTDGRGIGIGGLSKDYPKEVQGAYEKIPNAILHTIAEGGYAAIAMLVLFYLTIIVFNLIYGNILDSTLLVYILVYQLSSGNFLNPINWFIYGWIMADCIHERHKRIMELPLNNKPEVYSPIRKNVKERADGYKSELESDGKMKVCMVGSSGGHLTHMYLLKPFWEKRERFWVTFDKEDARSLLKDEKMYPCYFPTNRSLKAFVINTWIALNVLEKEKPDLIISAGAAAAVPFFYLGKLFGAKLVYIEVYDRIDKATLTGRLVYPIADKFIVQWEEQKGVYPKAENFGSIF